MRLRDKKGEKKKKERKKRERDSIEYIEVYHIIKMVISGAARLVGQVGQWAMAHSKGLGPHMNASCWLFRFLPYLPFQDPKLPYHLCKRCFREESIEFFPF